MERCVRFSLRCSQHDQNLNASRVLDGRVERDTRSVRLVRNLFGLRLFKLIRTSLGEAKRRPAQSSKYNLYYN